MTLHKLLIRYQCSSSHSWTSKWDVRGLTSCPQCWSDTCDMIYHLIQVKAKRSAARRRPIYTHIEMMGKWLLLYDTPKERYQALLRWNHRVFVSDGGIPNRAIRRGTLTASSWSELPTRIGEAPMLYCSISQKNIKHHRVSINPDKSCCYCLPDWSCVSYHSAIGIPSWI